MEDLTVGVGDGPPPEGRTVANAVTGPAGGAQSAFTTLAPEAFPSVESSPDPGAPPDPGTLPDRDPDETVPVPTPDRGPQGEASSAGRLRQVTAAARSLAANPLARRAGAGLLGFVVCCAVLSTGLTAWVAHRGGEAVIPAGAPAPSAPASLNPSASLSRVAALTPLLDRRASAVLGGRRAEWAATVDPATSGAAFRTRQLAEFDRIRLLPVSAWRYQVAETSVISGGAGTDAPFEASVRLTYRLAGDTRDVERTQFVTVERRTTGWTVTGLRRGSEEADPWELGPIVVAEGKRSVIVGIGRDQDRAALRRTATEADAAAARVDEVWGSVWRRTVVVFVPRTTEHLAAVLGRPDSAGLDQVAAITNGELSRETRAASGAADRVVLNSGPFARLTATGRRVVLTHELTHVATRASARVTVPLWVEEGFANHVAYRGSGLSRAAIAADVLPMVRIGTASADLPEKAGFDPADGTIAPAYADAWLAFDMMARQGDRKPLDFYRAAVGLDPTAAAGSLAPAETLAAAFSKVLGTDEDTFSSAWREYREALAKETR